MKNKIIRYGIIFLFFFAIFLLMLVSDGVFGNTIKNMTSWILVIIAIAFVLFCIIANIYYKLKK